MTTPKTTSNLFETVLGGGMFAAMILGVVLVMQLDQGADLRQSRLSQLQEQVRESPVDAARMHGVVRALDQCYQSRSPLAGTQYGLLFQRRAGRQELPLDNNPLIASERRCTGVILDRIGNTSFEASNALGAWMLAQGLHVPARHARNAKGNPEALRRVAFPYDIRRGP